MDFQPKVYFEQRGYEMIVFITIIICVYLVFLALKNNLASTFASDNGVYKPTIKEIRELFYSGKMPNEYIDSYLSARVGLHGTTNRLVLVFGPISLLVFTYYFLKMKKMMRKDRNSSAKSLFTQYIKNELDN